MVESPERITKRSSRAKAMVIAFALAVTMVFGYSAHNVANGQQSQHAQLPSPADLSRTFINVAKQVKPAVVHIEVVEKARTAARSRPTFPQIPGFPPFEQTPRRRQGTGSGVIISADGYILTNNHVAGEADEIKVKLSDGRELKARRVGSDPETDLAVIKVDAQNLPFAKLGDSDAVEQGEWVIALGSPFGLQQTMTAGIVSATGRDIQGPFVNYIQTDASINPGNSGGPLINMNGEVIGINTMIYSRSGGSEGIGFAIPSSLSSKVYAQLVKSGRVTRGYLGLLPGEVTPAIARSVNFKGTEGALVNDLADENSPAARAGLRSGDIIVEVDGKAVKNPRHLTELVADLPVGKAIQVKYARDGRLQTTSVTLGERPRVGEAETENDPASAPDSGKLGISVSDVTPEITRELKLKIGSGVVIERVNPDSPAAEAGLRRGDVIHRINSSPITSRQDLIRVMGSLKGDSEIVLQVERGGQLSFLTVKFE